MQNEGIIKSGNNNNYHKNNNNSNSNNTTSKQQISLVIIRLEIDDIDINSYNQHHHHNNNNNISEIHEKSKLYTTENSSSTATTTSLPLSSSVSSINNLKSSSLNSYTQENNIIKTDDSSLSSTSDIIENRDIYKLFSYNSPSYLQKKSTFNGSESTIKSSNHIKEVNLDEFSEKFSSKQEALRKFIGKRESQLLTIETYYFNKSKNSEVINENTSSCSPSVINEKIHTIDHQFMENCNSNNNTTSNNQHIVSNGLTIHKALETAYKDWNKDKINQDNKENNKPEMDDKNSQEESTIDQSTLTISPPSTIPKKLQKQVSASTNSISKITENQADNTSQISFYYGNPNVDIVKGFIHIYKDCNLKALESDTTTTTTVTNVQSSIISNDEYRSEMLCMLGIPANINCNELLGFLMPFNEIIEYIRIIRDTYPNQYMALLKFKNQKDADLFYSHNNNKQFNSIEENVCHIVYVERIEAMNSSKGGSLAIPGFTELPTCYICLERMDESLNGVITILCNHSFHANCLSKWGDTCCPVCRYSQTPDFTVDNTCSDCGSHESLWICLICGNVGCGRYVSGHAYTHFQLTQHTYSMQLGSNRVWDYAADNYVHRLIQNKTDGKLVQLDEGGRAVNQDEKIDSITLEYTYLLTSQLESQRLYFEERISKIEEKSKQQLAELEEKSSENEKENIKLKESQQVLSKERNTLEKKCSTLSAKVTKLQSELNEEKELNKCLSSNQEIYQNKLHQLEETVKKANQEKQAEIDELKLQLRDVMFYLDAQSKMSESKDITNEEIQDSQMIIQQDEASAGASGNSSKQQAKQRRRKK